MGRSRGASVKNNATQCLRYHGYCMNREGITFAATVQAGEAITFDMDEFTADCHLHGIDSSFGLI